MLSVPDLFFSRFVSPKFPLSEGEYPYVRSNMNLPRRDTLVKRSIGSVQIEVIGLTFDRTAGQPWGSNRPEALDGSPVLGITRRNH